MPPSQPPPWTGEEPRLPPRSRGGLGWGLCLNLTAKTLISLPKALATLWQGAGDSTGASAAIKWQVRWNFSTGQLDGLTLQPARCHDRATPYTVDDLPAGSLELADLYQSRSQSSLIARQALQRLPYPIPTH